MFSVFKRKNPYEQAARDIYATLLKQARSPAFYKECGVPDTFDGRFDLLLLHIFLVSSYLLEHEAQAEDFNQALFDETFADMDQTLREMGIGDMGVPKHQRKMMKAYNGRMHAYNEAQEQGDFSAVLARNVFGTMEQPPEDGLRTLERYIDSTIEFLKTQEPQNIISGRVLLKEP